MPPDPEVQQLMRRQAEIEHRAARLAMAFRAAKNEEERARLQREVLEHVAEQFKLRQEARERSLRRMKEELERLERSIRQRAENRESLIQRRLDQLLGEDFFDF
jgi:hypothetical protein